MRVHYRTRALDDIADIYEYRARQHSSRVAARVERAIRAAIDLLAESPEIGNETNHRRAMRRWPVREYPYAIFYSIDYDLNAVSITRVVHSGRVKDLRKTPD